MAGACYQVLSGAGPAAVAVMRLVGDGAEFLRRHVRLAARHAGDVRISADAPASPHSDPDALQAEAWRALAQSRSVVRAELLDADGGVLDDILLSVHGAAPLDVRLHLHGGVGLVRAVRELMRDCGIEEASDPPTLWGGDDGIARDAYEVLPTIRTLRGANWLLGQIELLRASLARMAASGASDEMRRQCGEIASRSVMVDWFARPARVVLVGPPNAGKSTLANALAGDTVSIVSGTPGTTRDWVEAPGELCGFPVVWIDTAGLRATDDSLEAAGIERTHALIRSAEGVVVVLDATPTAERERELFFRAYGDIRPTCVALNKADLLSEEGSGAPGTRSSADWLPARWRASAYWVSGRRGSGLDGLCKGICAGLGRSDEHLSHPAAISARIVARLRDAQLSADDKSFENNVLQAISG